MRIDKKLMGKTQSLNAFLFKVLGILNNRAEIYSAIAMPAMRPVVQAA
jgi:hypothetical protein